MLGNVKGVGKINHMGTISELPDISINLPPYEGPKGKDGSLMFDPYIAPEIILRKTLNNS